MPQFGKTPVQVVDSVRVVLFNMPRENRVGRSNVQQRVQQAVKVVRVAVIPAHVYQHVVSGVGQQVQVPTHLSLGHQPNAPVWQPLLPRGLERW